MYKGLVADVAKEVGRSAALILNQIYQWVKTKNRNKVYRTNEELKRDLCDIISTATIQRAKKKLIESGYLTVSFDKGLKRTTHFTLTDKAIGLLTSVKNVVVDKVTNTKPKENPAPKNTFFSKKQQQPTGHVVPKTMQKEFDNCGKKRATLTMPEALKKLIGVKTKEEKREKQEPLVEKQDDLSDEEYFGINQNDWAMIDIAQQSITTPEQRLSMSDVMNVAFNKVPNVEVFESNRVMLETASKFKEEW